MQKQCAEGSKMHDTQYMSFKFYKKKGYQSLYLLNKQIYDDSVELPVI